MSKPFFCGWDVGGAHLKAALLDAHGKVLHVVQRPCPLWRGLNLLEQCIADILEEFVVFSGKNTLCHAVTMTGELVDLFENRKIGVQEIARVMQQTLIGSVNFFKADLQTQQHFVYFSEVEKYWQQIASMNWLASAYWTAQQTMQGVLVDMGSTTTDFVVMFQGKPQPRGYTDAARLQTQELIYTGAVRTPLMAVTQKIAFQQQICGVSAEYFATTADVYRLLNMLPQSEDMAETADGQAKTADATARRIARMIGHDLEDARMDDWRALAENFKQKQLQMLMEATLVHVERLLQFSPTIDVVPIIGAGAGQFLLKQLVEQLNQPSVNQMPAFNKKIQFKWHVSEASASHHWESVCLPAVAVANLAYQTLK